MTAAQMDSVFLPDSETAHDSANNIYHSAKIDGEGGRAVCMA